MKRSVTLYFYVAREGLYFFLFLMVLMYGDQFLEWVKGFDIDIFLCNL